MTGYGFVRLHDAWMLDGDLVALLLEKRHDAVCVFFVAIAHAHAHDSDGYLSDNDKTAVLRAANAPESAWESLNTLGKISRAVGNSPRKRWKIAAYSKWQTTRDQRESDAERKAAARGRPTTRPSKREREEGTSEKTSSSSSSPRARESEDDEPFAVVDIDEIAAGIAARASARIAEIEASQPPPPDPGDDPAEKLVDRHRRSTLGLPYTEADIGWGKSYISQIRANHPSNHDPSKTCPPTAAT